ncbi:MAG: hypothetical protein J6S67_22640 [Methanobrevibacter sp.]|nr:hypothetical protein [Methanobrevibacter sp.]
MNKEVVGGIVGTGVTAVGTGLQTNEILQAVSIVLTIIGSIITIAMALTNWWKNAKKDGKITKEEINEGVGIIVDGANEIKDKIKNKEEHNDE